MWNNNIKQKQNILIGLIFVAKIISGVIYVSIFHALIIHALINLYTAAEPL